MLFINIIFIFCIKIYNCEGYKDFGDVFGVLKTFDFKDSGDISKAIKTEPIKTYCNVRRNPMLYNNKVPISKFSASVEVSARSKELTPLSAKVTSNTKVHHMSMEEKLVVETLNAVKNCKNAGCIQIVSEVKTNVDKLLKEEEKMKNLIIKTSLEQIKYCIKVADKIIRNNFNSVICGPSYYEKLIAKNLKTASSNIKDMTKKVLNVIKSSALKLQNKENSVVTNLRASIEQVKKEIENSNNKLAINNHKINTIDSEIKRLNHLISTQAWLYGPVRIAHYRKRRSPFHFHHHHFGPHLGHFFHHHHHHSAPPARPPPPPPQKPRPNPAVPIWKNQIVKENADKAAILKENEVIKINIKNLQEKLKTLELQLQGLVGPTKQINEAIQSMTKSTSHVGSIVHKWEKVDIEIARVLDVEQEFKETCFSNDGKDSDFVKLEKEQLIDLVIEWLLFGGKQVGA